MNLCDNGHDEICFEGHDCPLCKREDELHEQIADLEETVNDLRAEIAAIEGMPE